MKTAKNAYQAKIKLDRYDALGIILTWALIYGFAWYTIEYVLPAMGYK